MVRTALGLFLLLLLVATRAAALTVAIDVRVEGGPGRPVVSGTTNLPSGTLLMVSIEGTLNHYVGQQGVTVVDGTFKAGPFSDKSLPLKSGRYTVAISSPLVQFQPGEIAKIFGKGGANLDGRLVRDSVLGDEKVIEHKVPYRIGGKTGLEAENKAVRQDVTKARDLVKTLQNEMRKGEQLLKNSPTDHAIGQQSKRLEGVTSELIAALRRSIPECASMGSAAWPFWWYGMVARHNHGSAAAKDYASFGSDYQKELQKCNAALKAL